jgi:L-2-hydroxyglutarate oxidase
VVGRVTVQHPTSVGVVGGGIVGLAVARRLSIVYPGVAVTVFEKEDHVAAHQSGHNSGVVHAGVYYKPGSLKAQLCLRGAELLREFCAGNDVAYHELGKIIVASDESQLSGLADIETRALRNGVADVRRLDKNDIAEIEPFARGIAAIYSPHTGVVDYVGMCNALADEVRRSGGQVLLSRPVSGLSEVANGVRVTAAGVEYGFDQVIVCAGLHSDDLARAAGSASDLRIIPFRGEYYALRPEARHRVRGMIYPVPDPRYPFLGVHLTRDVRDGVHVGPNAVLAFAIEGYRFRDVSVRDLGRIAGWPGTWRLVAKHWQHGIKEMAASLSKRLYLSQVRTYVPDIELADLLPSAAGVRAQAIDRKGALVDDFVLRDAGRIFLVRNAPSPAATSSLAIAEYIVSSAGGQSPDAPAA